jgi:antitoxin component YwqK of YwqJK toxin-antitoxin module
MTTYRRLLCCGMLLFGGLLGAHHAAAYGPPAARGRFQAAADTLPGEVRRYYKHGQLRERYQLVNGLLEGNWVIYYASGRVYCEMSFQTGRPHGVYKRYDKKGRLERETGYVEGLLDGPWVSYHRGVKSIQAAFRHGRLEGRCASFYPTGALNTQAQYRLGRLVSNVLAYNKEGHLISEEVPNDAGERVVTVRTYDKAGRLKRSEAVDYPHLGTYLFPALMGGQDLGGKL